MDNFILNDKVKRRIAKRKRSLASPTIETKLLCGEYVAKFSKLRENEYSFHRYFKISIQIYDELFSLLEPYLNNINDSAVDYVSVKSPMECLEITLRYMASGQTFVDLHLEYQTGISTIKNIVKQVCQIIIGSLKEKCMPRFSRARWEEIEEGFLTQACFPNCIGAIDGKHIRIVKPSDSSTLSNYYKNQHSILLLAMCNANYEFTYVNVGIQGKNCDTAIFTQSHLFEQMNDDLLNIPPAKALPALRNYEVTNYPATAPMPYVIVGDEAFGLSSRVMRPYARSLNLDRKKKIFNYRLARARRFIESAFGIMTNQFRILRRPLNVSKETAFSFVQAICILHNFIRSRQTCNRVDDVVIAKRHIHDVAYGFGNVQREAVIIRDKFAEYFVTDGKVPWQDHSIA